MDGGLDVSFIMRRYPSVVSAGRIALRVIFMASVLVSAAPPLWAQNTAAGIEITAFHSQRYEDFSQGRVRCEVFGEIKNAGTRDLKGVTVSVEFLDEKGKSLGSEEDVLVLRVIAPREPVGVARPVKPGEYGNFNQDTVKCPDQWLEGRIRYKVVKTDWQ